MILSVSRRTDIPSYYSDWFYNRIKEGFVYTRNPMNPKQISRIDLLPRVVDCIVFWTKNPEPMMKRLEELSAYQYYFQFTLTPYGKDIECNIPHKKEKMIPVFQSLSEKIGKEKVIWRYDPIIFSGRYTMDYHLNAFAQMAEALNGYTNKCVISFVDMYAKIQKNMQTLNIVKPCGAEMIEFAKKICAIANENGMKMAACAETIDLTACGIERNACIDKELIEEIIGCKIKAGRDKNQRTECGCVESIDIGTYNTCQNGCKYCYANYSQESVSKSVRLYDADSPLLCGRVTEDKITERKTDSLKEEQLNLFA